MKFVLVGGRQGRKYLSHFQAATGAADDASAAGKPFGPFGGKTPDMPQHTKSNKMLP